MGYFSTAAAEIHPYEHDHSFTPPEMQLLWRLEDLESRLAELRGTQKFYEAGTCFSEDDLRYILPAHFKSATDVAAAIELAICDLKDRYGICVREEPEEEPAAVDEITGMQISFFDFLSMQTGFPSPVAA